MRLMLSYVRVHSFRRRCRLWSRWRPATRLSSRNDVSTRITSGLKRTARVRMDAMTAFPNCLSRCLGVLPCLLPGAPPPLKPPRLLGEVACSTRHGVWPRGHYLRPRTGDRPP